MKTMSSVLEGDCTKILPTFDSESIHLILSDIPYGIGIDTWDVLHENRNSALLGSSPAQLIAGSVFKRRGKPINGWSEADRKIPAEYYKWCIGWAGDWFRVLKPGGSAIVFAGRRLGHRCVCAMEDTGFLLKDTLAWVRPKAPHRAQRLSLVYERRGDTFNSQKWSGWRIGNLRPIFEPILWFIKPYKIGTTIADNVLAHGVGAYNAEALIAYSGKPDNILELGFAAGEGGDHPTQKPLSLMKALIDLTTVPGQVILDPFAGSGSTLVAAHMLRRQSIGIEMNPAYVLIARQRLFERVDS